MRRCMLNFAAMSQYFPDHTLEDLVEVCVQTGKAEAWEAFLHRTKTVVGATVAATMRRWKACKTVPVEDIIQEVYLKISKNNAALLRGFRSNYPNAIFGYLRATASSVASDFCKALSAARRGVQQQQQFGDQEPAAEISFSSSIEHEVLMAEVNQALQVVASGPTRRRDIVIFWLYYRQGFTASGIAAISWIGLTAKGVESTILRLTRLVRAAVGETRSDSAQRTEQSAKVIRSKSSL